MRITYISDGFPVIHYFFEKRAFEHPPVPLVSLYPQQFVSVSRGVEGTQVVPGAHTENRRVGIQKPMSLTEITEKT